MIILRRVLLIFTALALLPVVGQALIQQQRAQISVNIQINVSPNPLGYSKPPAASDTNASGIVAKFVVNPKESAAAYRAESLQFVNGTLVAQTAQQQGGAKVEAEISPNPLGTLLTSSVPGVQIPPPGLPLTQEAGTTVAYSCVFTVKVDTAQTAWTLEHGLFSDFSGLGGTFTGHDVAHKTYLQSGTPSPAYTPYIVYSDGQSWVIAAASGGTKTYCVDLQVTLPITLAGGAYTSNAVYTLFY